MGGDSLSGFLEAACWNEGGDEGDEQFLRRGEAYLRSYL